MLDSVAGGEFRRRMSCACSTGRHHEVEIDATDAGVGCAGRHIAGD